MTKTGENNRVKSLEEAVEQSGVSRYLDGLAIWFSPIPNFYIFTGFDCPRCGQAITWEWVGGQLPGITTPESIIRSKVRPEVQGAVLKDWAHRYLELQCLGCETPLYVHNFDSPLEEMI